METAIWNEVVAGLIKGATGEAGKVGFQNFSDALVRREEIKTSRVRVHAVPAPAPVIGRKILRVQFDVEVDQTMEIVGSPKVEAAIRLSPALLKMAAAHLLVSAALATIWVHVVRRILSWIKEKFEGQFGKKNKDGGDSAASN